MTIVAAVLDYKSAAIDVREKISFTSGRIREILRKIKNDACISGAVLLSTCNRTELYVSGQNMDDFSPARILCMEAEASDCELLLPLFDIKYGDDAVVHLMEVACGLQSMVLGEDQILTQVKNAALIAREEKASDATLETLFRLGVTAAKKAKTKVRIKAVPRSAAETTITALAKEFSFKGKKVLVTGNGEIGRLCCRKLVEIGAEVTITLRTYKHGDTIVPFGCTAIPYDDRSRFLSYVDAVISATSSPHYTITYEMVNGLEKRPELFLDLALPRDIEPRVGEISGVKCYNLDHFYTNYSEVNSEEINAIKRIIENHKLQYEKWSSYRRTEPAMQRMESVKLNY